MRTTCGGRRRTARCCAGSTPSSRTSSATANEGIGKPEALRHAFQGYWSRRITDEHRLVYRIVDDEIRIAACRYHYSR